MKTQVKKPVLRGLKRIAFNSMEKLVDMRDNVQDKLIDVKDGLNHMGRASIRCVKRNPLKTIGISILTGAAMSVAIMSSLFRMRKR